MFKEKILSLWHTSMASWSSYSSISQLSIHFRRFYRLLTKVCSYSLPNEVKIVNHTKHITALWSYSTKISISFISTSFYKYGSFRKNVTIHRHRSIILSSHTNNSQVWDYIITSQITKSHIFWGTRIFLCKKNSRPPCGDKIHSYQKCYIPCSLNNFMKSNEDLSY